MSINLNSFRSRVVGGGAIMGIAVVALMLSVNLYSIKEQLEYQVDARIDSIEVAYQTVFVTPLAEQNYAALHEIVDSLKRTGDISYIAVMDANGQRLDEIGISHDAPLPEPGTADSIRHLRFDITYLGQRYGSVQYGLSTDYLATAHDKLVLYNLGTALAAILLSCALLLVFSRHIVKPLHDLERAAERITSGNYDVQLKTIGVSELDRLTQYFSTMALTVSSKMSMLEWQAQHDALTDAYNRRAFEKHTADLLDDPLVVDVTMLYIDLDQFKAINDTCGHTAGDILLTRVAHLLESLLTNTFVARIGGDEFGAVVTLSDEQTIHDLAQCIIDDIANIHFEWEGQTYRVGASIGMASSCALGTRSLRDLLIAADTACFGAKELGRNRIQVYHPNDDYFRQRREDLRSVAQIDRMLAQGSFVLYHQRFTSLDDNLRLSHAEILLRVRKPDGGIDTPAAIIHAAERYNLMPHIDRWVIESACRQISQWEKEHIQIGIDRFGINVSGASLSDERFPDFVLGQIRASGVNPKRLCFEITESIAIANLRSALRFIESVRRIGAIVALDDFGSGLSSFAYLKRFQADFLKVDGAFISDIDIDVANLATVKAIVTLARAYGLSTVAEFVHNADILATVRDIGIDYAQGFHCHEPEPLEALVSGKHLVALKLVPRTGTLDL